MKRQAEDQGRPRPHGRLALRRLPIVVDEDSDESRPGKFKGID
jgi:hypothetical protein